MSSKLFPKSMILRKAIELSKKHGIENLSMRELAKNIGCSVSPIYDAYDSKIDLMKDVYVNILYINNSCKSYLDRNNQILLYGIRNPKLYLDIRKLTNEFGDLKDFHSTILSLMSKERIFSNFSNDILSSIHFDIMTYINGLVEKSLVDFKNKLVVTDYLYTLKQFTYLISYGYQKACEEDLL